jgi:hypothetical protein
MSRATSIFAGSERRSRLRSAAAAVVAAALAAAASDGVGGEFDLQARRRDHWAWQPIVAPAIPAAEQAPGSATPIDALLIEPLRTAGLTRAPRADKPALLRRATFDLTGLPPTPAELAAFEADASPAAFAKVVDRLLASPRFGERWARHWLDVVRYSETLGHEFDYPLADAWRYRDYVIRAFNADLPYDQFVREHIAGDLIDPPRLNPQRGFNESIIATAFWYLGEATHAPVDARADQSVRIDNQIDVLSKAFLGLTVGCARCHDHKFDAISTKDYYALAGYAASSYQQEALLDDGGAIQRGAEQLATLQERGRDAARRLVDDAAADGGAEFARALLAASKAIAAGATASDAKPDREAIAAQHSIDRARLDRLVAAIEAAQLDASSPLRVWRELSMGSPGAGDFAARRQALVAELEQRRSAAAAIRKAQADVESFAKGLSEWFPTGWAFGATTTAPGDWRPGVRGAELLPVGRADSGRLAAELQGVARSPKFTIEKPFLHIRVAGRDAQVRTIVDGYTLDTFNPILFDGMSFPVKAGDEAQWHVQNVARQIGHVAHIELVDHGAGWVAVEGIRQSDAEQVEPPVDAIGAAVLERCHGDSAEALAEAYGALWSDAVGEWRAGRATAGAEFVRWALSRGLVSENAAARAQLESANRKAARVARRLPAPARVVAISEGTGEDWRVQHGGDYRDAGELAPRRFLAAIAGADQPPAPARGSGRRQLADRMLAADNPFIARVMANRVWAHLLGRGVVPTVDNFGVLGERPSNPALLDYLAARFRDGGWSVKALIREIMLADAYQLSSAGDAASNERDPQNRLLHRANVKRLEGEAVRDALLAVSGRLDATPFGPPVPAFLTPFMDGRGRPKESGPLDGAGRRSIYLAVRRNFLSPMMLAYDAPLPATCVGQRNNSNVPAQALILMNDPFVLGECRRWAERALAEERATPADRVASLYLAAYGRRPTEAELAAAADFLAEQAAAYEAAPDDLRVWADLCHVLVNVKEFVFVK